VAVGGEVAGREKLEALRVEAAALHAAKLAQAEALRTMAGELATSRAGADEWQRRHTDLSARSGTEAAEAREAVARLTREAATLREGLRHAQAEAARANAQAEGEANLRATLQSRAQAAAAATAAAVAEADRVGRVLAASSGMATIEPTPSQALAPRSFAPARAQGHTPHRRRQYGADGGGGHRLRALGAAAHLLRPLTDQP
jgi:septal ring factor EnvC (AmiA/AmiB activator)|tara:strand:+ start:738 stop:1343 length:606 start_codon:yes stop_codon:yes gene_type:complete